MFDSAFRKRRNWPLSLLRSTEEGSPVGGVQTGNDDGTRCEGFCARGLLGGFGNARVLERPFSSSAAMATASTGSPEPMSEKQSFSQQRSAVVTSCALFRRSARKQGACKNSKLGNRIIELIEVSLIEYDVEGGS